MNFPKQINRNFNNIFYSFENALRVEWYRQQNLTTIKPISSINCEKGSLRRTKGKVIGKMKY